VEFKIGGDDGGGEFSVCCCASASTPYLGSDVMQLFTILGEALAKWEMVKA